MIEREPVRDPRAAIVRAYMEVLEAEMPHHGDQSAAIARFEYGTCCASLGGLPDAP